MNMAFLMCLWYFFNTLEFALDEGGFLDLSRISQRSMDANNIVILNFQILNFPLLNLSMVLAAML